MRLVSNTLVALCALTLAASALGRDVATVDGVPITDAAMQRAAEGAGPYGKGMLANPVARQDILDKLVDARLLARAAEAKGLTQDAGYKSRLDEAKTKILADLMIEREVATGTTDAAVRAFFAKDPARFGSREVNVSQIVSDDAASAQAALAEAQKSGVDFAALAQRLAKERGKAQQLELGWFGRGRMLPEFEQAAFETPVGKVHPHVVKTRFGFHVLKVVAERGSDNVEFEAAKERVIEALKEDLRVSLLERLRKPAKIAVNEEALRRLGID